MENLIISEYHEIIFEKMKADRLLKENGKPPFRSRTDFCRYCERIIQDRELQILRTEVMALEKTVDRYQERFNIVGSVHKAFFEDTPHGKAYKYLHIEQLLLVFNHTPMRFMDWFLERYCYMKFSKALPDYMDYLRTNGLEACFSDIAHALYRRFNFE
ncbi:conserved hypothetical protein [uncultured Eubacteriales bacterium]|uniref:Uncharacterized protein n=1 Tax=uncultured Eubacteriales bacterium TaxID=172733 RepID=A0A212K7K0_9FIRM|nr:conserved hypothetical protein [uncultured Eubacteriales bacterium]